MPKIDLSFSANFLQQTFNLKLSGILDLSLFSQISAGELRSYYSWKFRNYSVMAKLYLVLFPQIFSRKPQILSSLEIYSLVFRKFLLEILDFMLSGK